MDRAVGKFVHNDVTLTHTVWRNSICELSIISLTAKSPLTLSPLSHTLAALVGEREETASEFDSFLDMETNAQIRTITRTKDSESSI